jgi:hypothetical protein
MRKVTYEELKKEIYNHPEGGVIFSDSDMCIHISLGTFGATTLEFDEESNELFAYDFSIEEEVTANTEWYLYSNEDLDMIITYLKAIRQLRQ